jgi:hypothetical protein
MPKTIKQQQNRTEAIKFIRPDLTLKQLEILVQLRFGDVRDYNFPIRSCHEVADMCGLLHKTVIAALARIRKQNYVVKKGARLGRIRKPI